MPEVGSPQWIEALAASVDSLDARDLHITVLHRIVDGPAWVLSAVDGAVTVQPADPEASADVTFTWQAGDVDAVAGGTSTPLSVFQAGRLRVGGDLRRLAEATDLFATFPGVPA